MHLHEMRDSDNHFVIDPATMAITNKSKKHKLQQGDHNSEIYSFEIPRLLEGHDMTLCNLVQIHYINIKVDKTEQQSDVYKVTDMAVCDPETDTLVFTWTVHGNATQYAGSLNFRIHFYCINDKGEYTYKKHTEIFKGITISDGFDNVAAIEEAHSDILSVFEARLDALEKGIITAPDYSVYFDIDVDGLVSLKTDYQNGGSKNAELPEVLVIPDVINNIAVSALAEQMFEGNLRIKSLTIPKCISILPLKFANNAIHLEELNGTENIEVIGQAAFQFSGIKKAMFPNLKTFEGAGQFNCAAKLAIADIGNTVTEIPQSCFANCDRLSLVRGGASVTATGKRSFFCTSHLKNLPLVSNVKSFGEEAFVRSRVDCDWWALASKLGSTAFETDATPAQYNPTKWWDGCTYTPYKNPLGSTFHQRNPEWSSHQIPNSDDTYYKGCNEISAAHIYSALTGEKFSSPRYFVETVVGGVDNGSLLTPSYKGKTYNYGDIARWFTALGKIPGNTFGINCKLFYRITDELSTGWTEDQYPAVSGGYTKDSLQEIYDALADGALILTAMYPGHAAVIYGIAENGEMLVLDSDGSNYRVQDYTAQFRQMPMWSIALGGYAALIVRKSGGQQ